MASAQTISVPVVYQELRPQESVHQVLDQLEQLTKTVDFIFNKLEKRVTEQQQKLNHVNQRLEVARNKIEQVSTRKTQATTVFAPAKLPCKDEPTDYIPLYVDEVIEDHVLKKRPHYRLEDVPHEPADVKYKPDNSEFLLKENKTIDAFDRERAVGMGRLPKNLHSVSSLLLFNSSAIPYNEYASLDNLAGKDRESRLAEKRGGQLSAAPTSFSESIMPQVQASSVDFRPVMGVLPSLDSLPSVLTGLSGVAQDISLERTSRKGDAIAPSLQGLDLDDLPEIEPTPAPTVSGNSGVTAPPPPEPVIEPPVAPPMPQQLAPAPSHATHSVASHQAEEIFVAADAPVAPPPPMEPLFSAPKPPKDLPDDVSDALGDRGGLLRQIQEGKKLRPASERKAIAKKPSKAKKAPPPPSGGDFFGEIANAIHRRRKGIAQKIKDTEEQEEITGPDEWED